jgi:hypothetical protein
MLFLNALLAPNNRRNVRASGCRGIEVGIAAEAQVELSAGAAIRTGTRDSNKPAAARNGL